MRLYHDLLRDIRDNGIKKDDRTGIGTRSVFGRQVRFDLSAGFPLVTTKRIHLKSVIYELLWFLMGDTNVGYLNNHGVTIWDEWADEKKNLGPVYGHQWRFWPARNGGQIDQIAQVVDQIRKNPNSRRLMVTAMNIADYPDDALSPNENAHRGKMALAPCHAFFQFYVANGKLSCFLYCRSQDTFLGTPFNWASYALLTHMVAQQCDLGVGELIWAGGDCHIYKNHLEAVETLLKRPPFPLPRLILKRKPPTIFDYQYEDFEVMNYQYHPAIPVKIAV
jgi:thymidylate synthase